MKKIWYLFLLSLITRFSTSISFAWYDVDSDIKNRIDVLMSVVERQWWSQSTFEQINKYGKIINSFSKIQLEWEQKEMIWYLLYLFQEKVVELKKNTITQDTLITNVDWERVGQTRLSWHNTERNNLWLNNYKLNDKLNFTALTWAENLARNNKTSYTHTRNAGDWYYNYDKILSRFGDLWVTFGYGATAFTENVAYQYYNCNKTDCTDDMIAALKKWFNFFMSERSWKWPHYKAVTHPYFTDMGFGVGVSGKKYWVVTHYGVNVE